MPDRYLPLCKRGIERDLNCWGAPHIAYPFYDAVCTRFGLLRLYAPDDKRFNLSTIISPPHPAKLFVTPQTKTASAYAPAVLQGSLNLLQVVADQFGHLKH
jgi:hypothetical protein